MTNIFTELEKNTILPEPKHWWKSDVENAISLCREGLKKEFCVCKDDTIGFTDFELKEGYLCIYCNELNRFLGGDSK